MNGNIIIVGVGGQGILLTSKILGHLSLRMGKDIKVSEVHGMSQRGGSVITHVRIGDKVDSPLVDAGQADYVLSFEKLEAMRAEGYLRENGVMIYNTQKMLPMPVISGKAVYPEKEPAAKNRVAVDALELAGKAGSVRSVNIVLLGVLSAFSDWDEQAWKDSIAACVPPKTLEVNLKAFDEGRKAAGVK